MNIQESTGQIDIESLRRGYEQRDADLLVSLYADEAELRVVDRTTPPSSPLELRGKAEIAEYWREICSRDMTHRIENEVIGKDHLAFNVECEYLDGTRVLAAMSHDLRDGKIVRQVNVQAWDEWANHQKEDRV